jgi:hypothetical protein
VASGGEEGIKVQKMLRVYLVPLWACQDLEDLWACLVLAWVCADRYAEA